ncbi:hypothetical protein [Levilactobacillus phage ENFP1]|nr:hypothetical protein [Levilactobacillus phage ENFP1]
METISEKQQDYLRTLMGNQYSILNITPEELVGNYLDSQEVTFDTLSKSDASVLIGVLSALNKYEKKVK